MNVYITTMQAVYDHGTAGVFTTFDDAVEHAKAVYDDSDKHHRVRIDEVELDVGYWPSCRAGGMSRRHVRVHGDTDPSRSWVVASEDWRPSVDSPTVVRPLTEEPT